MSIGTEPPFGWGGEEPLEAVVKLNAGNPVVLGSVIALDLIDAAAGTNFKIGSDGNIMHAAKGVAAAEAGPTAPRGYRGVVIDLMQGAGAAGTEVLCMFRGVLKANVGTNNAVPVAIAPGAKLGLMNVSTQGGGTVPESYLDAEATATHHCVAYYADAGFTPSAADALSRKQVFFNGVGEAYGVM